jgi:hypothetical protein
MMKKSKTFMFGLAVMTIAGFTFLTTGTGFAACPANPDALWHLDETDSEAAVSGYVDEVGGNTGAGNDAPLAETDPADVVVNSAQQFNGSNTGIDVPVSRTFNWLATDSFSIELWVKSDQTDADARQVFIGRNSGSTSLQWWVGMENGNVLFKLNGTDVNVPTFTGATTGLLNDGGWHHVVAVRDETGVTDGTTDAIIVYVDGNVEIDEVNNYAAGFDSETARLSIGYLNLTPFFRFSGWMDEVGLYGRALTPAEIQANYQAGLAGNDVCGGSVPSDAPYPDNTISLWHLDETDSEAAVSGYVDEVGGNTGAGNDAPLAETDPADVVVNSAQQFNGSNTGIDVPVSRTFNWLATDSFSIELWVKSDQTDADARQVFIGRNSGSTSLQWWVGMENGNVLFKLNGTDVNVPTFTGATTGLLNDGGWHHVVAVRDETGVTDGTTDAIIVYVDGNVEIDEVNNYAAGFDSETARLSIGYLNLTPFFRFSGWMDEVGLYGRALTPTEITAHYQAGLAGNGVESLRPEPVAIAGTNQTVTAGADVTLDGTSSSDSQGGTIVAYLWEETTSSGVTLNTAGMTPGVAMFTAPTVTSSQILTFRLTVTDDDGLSSSDTVNVTVNENSVPVVTPPVSGGGGGGGGCFISSIF